MEFWSRLRLLNRFHTVVVSIARCSGPTARTTIVAPDVAEVMNPGSLSAASTIMQYSRATQPVVQPTGVSPLELWARASDHQGLQTTIMHPYAPNDIRPVNKNQCAVIIYVRPGADNSPDWCLRANSGLFSPLRTVAGPSSTWGWGTPAAVAFCEPAARSDWPVQAPARLEWRLPREH